MERDERERHYDGRYTQQNRNNRFENDNISWHKLNQNFNNSNEQNRSERRQQNDNRFSDNDNFRDYHEQEYDLEHDYYDNLRHNQHNTDNIRQGYGISSFAGTSDRYGTVSNTGSEREAQERQDMRSEGWHDSRRNSGFGSAYGESGIHSDRGIPNYGTRNFSDNNGTGMGSSSSGGDRNSIGPDSGNTNRGTNTWNS